MKTTLTRQLPRKWHKDTGTYDAAEYEMADIEVTADLGAIARTLGPKAMSNNSRVAKDAGGYLVVKATNIRKYGQ
jgi:hypothetical protein